MSTPEAPLVAIAEIDAEEFKLHVQRVESCVTVLNGVLAALSKSPMLAAFIPPELRVQIAALSPEA